jgi:WD40 repeat protein
MAPSGVRINRWCRSRGPGEGHLGKIGLLDAATSAKRAQLRGHRGAILSLAFSADGTRLLSASADRTAFVWDVPQGLRMRDAKAK